MHSHQLLQIWTYLTENPIGNVKENVAVLKYACHFLL